VAAIGAAKAPLKERTVNEVGPQETPNISSRRPPVSRKARIGLAVVACVLFGAAIGYELTHGHRISTDDAYTDGRAITVAPHVAGYVASLAVTDNEFVHAGQLLLRIECSDYAVAHDRAGGTLEAARGQLAAAQSNLELAGVTFPARFDAARATLTTENANLFRARSEFKRQHDISREATTLQDIDFATAAEEAAEGQVAQAKAEALIAQPVLLNIAVARAHVAQLRGEVKQAEAELAQTELNVSWCEVKAPQDGWVTKRNVEQGNYVQMGQQLFSIVSPEVWVTANFKENQLTRMRAGQKVSIAVDAYPSLKLKGHVDSIQLGSGAKFTAFPPENATGNFIKIVQRVPVKIVIDSGLDPKLPLPLNVSVEPTVELR
jgi:membrane fusion protein, multidrug efflux system